MVHILSTPISTVGTITFAALSSYFVLKKLVSYSKAGRIEKERASRLVIIVGCDTGLGYSMAVWASKLGYTVIAACLNENGEGAQELKKQFPDQIIIAGLNVTDKSNLESFHVFCKEVLETNKGKLRLWAIISNAAICTIGEFFWQTRQQRELQMEVNYWGTVNLISELKTLLFDNKARVIVVSSDCSEYPLPYLSSYCASKSALNSWIQSFRFEVAKYGIHVAAYQPRGFATNSNLFSNIDRHYNDMAAEMTSVDKNFYGDYFDNFMKRKQEVFESTRKLPIQPLNSDSHQQSIIYLLENDIRNISVYRDFSWIENVFHAMYKYLPQFIVDRMVGKVLNPDSIPWIEQNENVMSS